MTLEQARQAYIAKNQLTEEAIVAGAREELVQELVSKRERVSQLETELNAARESLVDTEATVTSLDVPAEIQG